MNVDLKKFKKVKKKLSHIRDTGYCFYRETDRRGADCIVATWRLTITGLGLAIK
jgi:DNA-binding IclR family transcriptional regulator